MKHTNYQMPLSAVIEEIRIALRAGALFPALTSIFSLMDTMAYLYTEQEKQNRTDFINWVDKYLKTSDDQTYQYTGKDMYGARCGLLHSLVARSDYVEQESCKLYAYDTKIQNHEINSLRVKQEHRDRHIIISVWRLFLDLENAINNFFDDISKNSSLKIRVDARAHKLFWSFQYAN
jgi:hypothetical protein